VLRQMTPTGPDLRVGTSAGHVDPNDTKDGDTMIAPMFLLVGTTTIGLWFFFVWCSKQTEFRK
jgi:hypothetical protein